MAYPGVVLMVMVGIGVGAFLYYMFASSDDHNDHQYQHGGDEYHPPQTEPSNSWCTSKEERSRRRKRGPSSTNGIPECTICLVELFEKESILVFPCGHEFHKICITEWHIQGPQEARDKCPNCREGIFGLDKW